MLDVALLVLRVAFLVLLYLFIFWVVRGATRSVVDETKGAGVSPAQPGLPTAFPETPTERRARREQREVERTMDGERIDFSQHINPRLVVEASPVLEVGAVYDLTGWVNVGRSPVSDIVLDDQFVSQTHARIVPRGQLQFVEDLGSTNGTFVDDREVLEAQLKPDSRLRIGETTFRYEE